MPPAFAPFKVARSSAVVVRRATIPRDTTGNRIGAASVIVGGLHGFRSWLPLSGGSMPVRNSSEHLRPSNNAAPDPIPPQNCPPLPQTKGDLLRRFSLGPNSELENKLRDTRLPSRQESRDSESWNDFGRTNGRNLGAPRVERHREWPERQREARSEPEANSAKERKYAVASPRFR